MTRDRLNNHFKLIYKKLITAKQMKHFSEFGPKMIADVGNVYEESTCETIGGSKILPIKIACNNPYF